ncbi:MAG: 30S ribosomal protein S17e [Candidatus Bathyarchaeota archaeon]
MFINKEKCKKILGIRKKNPFILELRIFEKELGSVRTTLIKRISRQLIEKYPEVFTEDFEKNKKVVGEVLKTNSKEVKNQVAGYITSIIKVYKKTSK